MQNYLENKIPGAVKPLLCLPKVTEIMLNPLGELWYKHIDGQYVRCENITNFDADNFVHAVANYAGKIIDAKTPFIDCVLPFNGERFNATIPPIVEGVSFNIRKHLIKNLSLDDYVNSNVLTSEHAAYLKKAVQERKNIIISGGPASGKTTFANALLKQIAIEVGDGQRMLILEDTRELQCTVPNHKSMLTNADIDMRKLLWLAMRNSPDRITVGEVRDGSALDLAKAFNTGCPGGLATIHANSAKAALQRMVDLCVEAISTSPNRLIAEAINIVVQISQDAHHPKGRCVTELIEVIGFDHNNNDFSVLHH